MKTFIKKMARLDTSSVIEKSAVSTAENSRPVSQGTLKLEKTNS